MSELSPFDLLGVPCSLLLDGDELKKAFQEKSSKTHPDCGGDTDAFAKLNTAYTTLLDPASRLRAWIQEKGVKPDDRGAITGDLVEHFSSVADLLSKADALIHKREQANSALAKALLESDVFNIREAIENKIDELSTLNDKSVREHFATLEQRFTSTEAGEVLRMLAFIAKWLGQLRERFGKLW